MKNVVSIFLAVTLLLLSVRDLVTIAAFEFQQEQIAATLCVKKYEPIPMCAGQCFLEQQLDENHQQDELPLGTTQPDLQEKTVYFQPFATMLKPVINTLSQRLIIRHADLRTLFLPEIASPPPQFI